MTETVLESQRIMKNGDLCEEKSNNTSPCMDYIFVVVITSYSPEKYVLQI